MPIRVADIPLTIDVAAHCSFHGPEPRSAAAVTRDLDRSTYTDMAEYAAYCEAAGIDGVVLSQVDYMGSDDATETRQANDTLYWETDDYNRFYCLAALPTSAGVDAAADEFDRCLENGLNGGAINTTSVETLTQIDEMAPVFEVADGAGAPILIHPRLSDSLRSPLLEDALMNGVFGREMALAITLTKIIHSGILDKYQDLNLIFHHLAGNISGFLPRMHNQMSKFRPLFEPPAAQKSLITYEKFHSTLTDRVFIDTAGYRGNRQVLRAALDSFPTSQILFGTDFPFETRSVDDFNRIRQPILEETTPEVAADILSGNVLDLLVNT